MIPTARVERPPLHRGGSASTGIVPATPLSFQQPMLEEGHAGIGHRRIVLVGDPAVVA